MLEERLKPVLGELRTLDEENERARYQVVRNWFGEHEENLVDSAEDLTYVCELPHSERWLVTNPVMGNFFLDRMSGFEPKTEHQAKVFPLLRSQVSERRFNNHHMKEVYDRHEEFMIGEDRLNSAMFKDTSDSMVFHDLLKKISKEIYDVAYSHKLPMKEYTTDLGHGLAAPANGFSHITFYLDSSLRNHGTEPFGMNIMVVDDESPQDWYQRMLSVGFKHDENQKGFFFDCESALKALEQGEHYDVILSDLELGDGKMGGIEFVERAHRIQRLRGIRPRISVFSYNAKMLQKAEDKLRGPYFGSEDSHFTSRVFHQVNHNTKPDFSAARFRWEVELSMGKS